MAQRAHFRKIVRDLAGNAIANALCYFYKAGTTTAVTDLYNVKTGGSPVETLVSNSRGEVEGWTVVGETMDVKVTDNGHAAQYAASGVFTPFTDFTRTIEVYLRPEDLGAASGGGGSSSGNWTTNLPFGTHGLKLDVYKEPTGTKPTNGWPVVLLIHGGGPTGGDQKTNVYGIGDDLASIGIRPVTMQYRSWNAPGPNYSMLDIYADARDAMAWIVGTDPLSTAADFEFDITRIGSLGESWGGALAGYLGTQLASSDPARVKCWLTCSGIHDFKKFVQDTGATGQVTPSTKAAIAETAYGGIPAPGLAQGATGDGIDATGLQYVVTYKDSLGGETLKSAIATITLSVNPSHCTVTRPAFPTNSAGFNPINWVIYRTGATGTAFRKVVELPIGTTSYDDANSRAAITGNPAQPTQDTSNLADYISNRTHLAASPAVGYLSSGEFEAVPTYEVNDMYSTMLPVQPNVEKNIVLGSSNHGLNNWAEIKTAGLAFFTLRL